MGIKKWLGGSSKDARTDQSKRTEDADSPDQAPRQLVERVEDLEQRMSEVATEEHIDVNALDKRVGLLEGRIPDKAWFREQLKASAIEEKVDHTLVKQAIQDEHDAVTDQIAHLEERLTELESTTKQFQTLKIEDLVRSSDMEHRIEGLRDELEDRSWIEQRLESLEIAEASDVNALNEQMEDLKDRLDSEGSAQDDLAALKDDVSALKERSVTYDQLSEVRSDINDLERLKTQLNELELAEIADIGAMQAQMDELETAVSGGDSGDLQADIDELREAVADLQAAQQELEPVREAVEAHEQVNKRVDAVMDAATMLDERLANLAEIVELRGQKIDRVSTDEKQTKDDISDIEHALEAFEQRLTHLDDELSALEHEEPDVRKEDLLEVEHRLDNLQKAITTLQKTAKEHALESEIGDLKQDLLKLSDLVLKLLDRRKPAEDTASSMTADDEENGA